MKCRCVTIHSHRIISICPDDVPVDTLYQRSQSQNAIRIEPVPEDQLVVDPAKEMLLPVAHYTKVGRL